MSSTVQQLINEVTEEDVLVKLLAFGITLNDDGFGWMSVLVESIRQQPYYKDSIWNDWYNWCMVNNLKIQRTTTTREMLKRWIVFENVYKNT